MVDAQCSERCIFTGVEVRVLSSAPKYADVVKWPACRQAGIHAIPTAGKRDLEICTMYIFFKVKKRVNVIKV